MPIPSSAPTSASTGRPTVMLLDDDGLFRALISDRLRSKGYEVVEARTVAVAQLLLLSTRIDAVIVDGLLPDATGVSFIEKLRSGGSRIPVAFASAFWRDEGSRGRLRDVLGVDCILKKPVDPADLVNWLERHLASALGRNVPSLRVVGAVPARSGRVLELRAAAGAA